MADQQWQKVREIFDAALRQRTDLRQNYVIEACGENISLLGEVESLLSSLDSAENFMETPAVAKVADSITISGNHLKKGHYLGHYEIIKQIGTGGMGKVYLASDSKLDRQVAVKILNEKFSGDKSNLERFIHEAKSASALNHPNILTIYEFGKSADAHYIVSEYIKGKTLREVLKEKTLPLTEILDFAIQIANALCAAHEAHLIHRDIKPENIMIRPDGFAKVLDFGLAKLVRRKNKSILGLDESTIGQNETAKGLILGTVNYMSPEQAKGEKVDERTDIFSFGVLIYEMVTGRTPFAGDSTAETFANLINQEPQPVSRFTENIPKELELIVSEMLRKDKYARYQTMKGLFIDLRHLQKHLDFNSFEIENVNSNLIKNTHCQWVDNNAEATFNFSRIKSSEGKPREIKILSLLPNNLSTQTTKLIGREKEITEIVGLLKNDNIRLITLTGVGGTGKTRLAKEVGWEMLSSFADGVFFVDLIALTNDELVVSAIAQTLGLKEAGNKPLIKILKDYLGEKRMLLVVDNFEQVINAASQISELLSACKNLKILVTSRILLRLSIEREFVVHQLNLPDETEQASPDELLKYEAVRLFVERTRIVNPSFSLTKENSQTVADICVRLDGLPLAIELAAARMKVLNPQEILQKLEKRLPLLTGGMRDLPTHQRTMHDTLKWSYDLLSNDEKKMFRSISVFAGNFTFEAAETIYIEDKPDESPTEILDLITSLIDKSLIVSKVEKNGSMCLRMLEVVREYALEVLESSGEAETKRLNHADFFLRLGEKAAPHLQASNAREWLDRLENDHDNLRTAICWLLENDTEKAARLAKALRIYLINHSHLSEGREWLEKILKKSVGLSSNLKFRLLNALGWLAVTQGDYTTAHQIHEETLIEARKSGNRKHIAESLRGLGATSLLQDNYAAAQKLTEEALAINRELNDKFGIAASLNGLVTLILSKGDTTTALPLIEESLTLFKQLGNDSGVCYSLLNLGEFAYHNGDYQAARQHFAEVLTTAKNLGFKDRISFCLDGFAALAAQGKEWKKSALLIGAAEKLRETIGYELETHQQAFRNKYLEKVQTQLGDSLFSTAYEEGYQLKLEDAIKLGLSPINDLQTSTKNISDEKLDGTASPAVNATQFLQVTTGDANFTTAQTQNSISQQIKQRPVVSIGLVTLLVAIIGFGIWYFYTAKNLAVGDKKSIAVLPLKPINSANRDDIYEVGIADSLILQLSSIKGFIVRPLSATRKYGDIAQDPIEAGIEQKVDYVLASNYQVAGGKIRITAQLFNIATGQIEETYKSEKDAGDLFAMQDSIANEVGNKLMARFATTSSSPMAKRGTNNEEAYRLYLQGRNLTMKRGAADQRKAIECFEQAIKLDPNYALAYARMAGAYLVAGLDNNSLTRAAKVREFIKKALELDNNLAEAYAVRGQVNMFHEYDYPAAEKNFLRAIELEPNNETAHWLYAMLLTARGRLDEAMTEIEIGQAIDPAAPRLMRDRGKILYYARRYDEAIVQYKRMIDLDGNSGNVWLQRAYGMKGDETQAYEIFMNRQKRDNPDRLEIYQKTYETAGWSGVERKWIEFSKLDEPENGDRTFDIAVECSLLGDKEQAFEYLNKAVEQRAWRLSTLNVEPQLDSLRDDPRFDELVRRVGLK